MTRAGQVVRIFAAVGACLLASVAAAETLVVEIGVEPTGRAPVTAVAAEVLVSYTTEETEEVRRTVEVPGHVEVDLPVGVVARVAAGAEGWWAPATVIHLDRPTSVRVLLRPTGWVEGELRVPSGEELPDRLGVRVRRVAEPDGEGALTEAGSRPGEAPRHCPAANGRFRCEVPSGQMDLRLRAEGFVSHHGWGVDVPAHGAVSVGTLELRAGASIVGWVEAPRRGFRFDRVRVRVRPLAAGTAPTSLDRKRWAALLMEAPVNIRGFFEVTSIPPGSFEVVVEHEDFAPAHIAPVKVVERSETEIHRVRLEPAVDLEVGLTPPAHPFRRPWYVELLREGEVPGHRDVVAEGAATLEGRWRHGGLAPGDYEIRVGDGRGGQWASQQVTLGRWDQLLEVELPFDRLEGTLRLADEPIAAVLHFGGRHGARRIPIRSDDDGKFYVFLPHQEEPWFADVVEPTLGLDVRVTGIEVRRLPGEPWAKTVIDLPDTRIFGHVVDEAGTFLGGAVVEIVAPDGEYLATTRSAEGDGEFQFVGLAAGPVSLQARLAESGRRLSSGRVAVEVEEGDEAESVRLVLREDLEVDGLVLTPSGQGIPGAQVMARLNDSQGSLPATMPSATTHVDGGFTLRLPRGVEQVVLSVLAPGYAVRSLPVATSSDQPLIVELDPTGGTLVISYSGGDGVASVLRQHRTEIFRPHLVAQSGALRRWAELHGESLDDSGRYVVPMLEPGPYTVCYDVGFGVLSSGWLPPGGLPDRCAGGILAPHGELHLTVPVPEAEEEAGRGGAPDG